MLKKFTLVFALVMSGAIVYDLNYNIAHTNNIGAPAGRTGNPGEFGGATCSLTGCHVGGPAQSNEEATITSDIPGTGYVPGETYTITVTMTKTGGTKFGFQVSPQDNSGGLLGTLSNPSSGTQLVGGSKYATHNASGNTGTGMKTWTFDWTAPSAGTGDVTFWGAYNFANGNNSVTGDVIVNNSVVFSEGTSSITELNSSKAGFSVYPNPVSNEMSVAFSLTEPTDIAVELFSIDGKLVSQLAKEQLLTGDHNFTYDLSLVSSGVYFVRINDGEQDYYRKVMVK